MMSTWFQERLAKSKAQLPNLARALRLMWHAAPREATLRLGLLLLQVPLPGATIWLTRILINRLTGLLAAGLTWQSMRTTLGIGAAIAGLLLFAELVRIGASWTQTALAERVRDHIRDLIHERSLSVDLAFYDSPDYYDQLYRARAEADYRPIALLESLGGVLRDGLSLGGMAAVLLPFGVWMPGVLLLSALPGLALALRNYEREHRWRQATTPLERRAWYYDWMLTSRHAAAEMRLYGLGPSFRTLFRSLRSRLRAERLRLTREQSLASLAASTLEMAIGGGIMLWMIGRVSQGLATLGDLVLLYEAFRQGQSMLRGVLNNVGLLYANSLFLGNLFAFLDLTPALRSPPSDTPLD